jgi:hypothetical protein
MMRALRRAWRGASPDVMGTASLSLAGCDCRPMGTSPIETKIDFCGLCPIPLGIGIAEGLGQPNNPRADSEPLPAILSAA